MSYAARDRKIDEKQLHLKYKKIDADYNICFYCGDPGNTKDHVPPLRRARTSEGPFLLIPACCTCNSYLSCAPVYKISDRARYLIRKYYEKHKRLLAMPRWGKEEIEELGYRLRQEVLFSATLKAGVEATLVRLETLAELYEASEPMALE